MLVKRVFTNSYDDDFYSLTDDEGASRMFADDDSMLTDNESLHNTSVENLPGVKYWQTKVYKYQGNDSRRGGGNWIVGKRPNVNQ